MRVAFNSGPCVFVDGEAINPGANAIGFTQTCQSYTWQEISVLPAPVWVSSASLLLQHKLYGWKYFTVLGLRYILDMSNIISLLNIVPSFDLLCVCYANLLMALNDFFSEEKWILGDKLFETFIGKFENNVTKAYSKFHLDFLIYFLKMCFTYIYTHIYFFFFLKTRLGNFKLWSSSFLSRAQVPKLWFLNQYAAELVRKVAKVLN